MNDPVKSEPLSRNVLILLLAVCAAAIVIVVVLVMRPGEREPERIITVIEAPAPEEAGLNVLQVEDAIADPSLQASEGRRYKVLITDNAREGASGIARIGGLVTFVPNTRKGDVAVIEVTELRRTTANANLIEVLASGQAVPERPSAPPPREREPRAPQSGSALIGQTYRGTVEALGREGDGIVKVNGKVVFVPGTAVGEHVEFRVVDDAGRFAMAELTGKSDTPYPDEAAAAPSGEKPAPQAQASSDLPVAAGDEYVVEVTEQDRNNPQVDGVARIDNFVVFVPGTQPGDRVRIRITDLRRRSANSEVLERLPAEDAVTP